MDVGWGTHQWPYDLQCMCTFKVNPIIRSFDEVLSNAHRVITNRALARILELLVVFEKVTVQIIWSKVVQNWAKIVWNVPNQSFLAHQKWIVMHQNDRHDRFIFIFYLYPITYWNLKCTGTNLCPTGKRVFKASHPVQQAWSILHYVS